MFHMSAMLPMLATMWAGGRFITDTHFEADAAMRAIVAEKPTILFTAFPTIMSALVSHPDFDAEAMSQVRLVNNVAPPDQLKANMKVLPQGRTCQCLWPHRSLRGLLQRQRGGG